MSIAVRRIVASGDADLAVAHLGGISRAAGFHELEGGKIRRATEYRVEADAERPPAWRERWLESL